MNQYITSFVEYVKNDMPTHNKETAQLETQQRFGMTKDGKVYYTDYFAVRFCYSKNGSFSNTVLALSKLQKFDHIPFFVVLIKGNQDNALFLANSSLLQKISHSSQELRIDNIKGSFNGSDIIKTYNDIPNDFDHVEQLFAIHQGFTWEENLERLVEATSQIKPHKEKFKPNKIQIQHLFSSVDRAREFVVSEDYLILKNDLDERVQRNFQSIFIASRIENVNIRGRLIEYLITTENNTILDDLLYIESQLPVFDTRNGLGDYVIEFPNRKTYTDIKTKIMYLGSNPKAYNVDKFLECMSEENSVFMFYLVGIDEKGLVNCVLCSVYDKQLIDATILQFHWAGRATRGGAQFNGNSLSDIILAENFSHNIDSDQCKAFLQSLLDR
ncbi:hypothetical protein [Porphyromonas gulae]|uniref:hypothetical protein n=1 Tax=Porphyromonas gulae TaxID=111105 RepID=UPI0026F1481C|nr:hypothetical protein [Porphyromonas gulae]